MWMQKNFFLLWYHFILKQIGLIAQNKYSLKHKSGQYIGKYVCHCLAQSNMSFSIRLGEFVEHVYVFFHNVRENGSFPNSDTCSSNCKTHKSWPLNTKVWGSVGNDRAEMLQASYSVYGGLGRGRRGYIFQMCIKTLGRKKISQSQML